MPCRCLLELYSDQRGQQKQELVQPSMSPCFAEELLLRSCVLQTIICDDEAVPGDHRALFHESLAEDHQYREVPMHHWGQNCVSVCCMYCQLGESLDVKC